MNEKRRATEHRPFEMVDIRATAGSSGHGGFEAIAQVYGLRNDHGEIFEPGCFAKSVAERIKGPRGSKVRVTDGHEWSVAATLGIVTDARDTDAGLWVSADFADTPRSQDARALVRDGIIRETSIEFRRVREAEAVTEDHGGGKIFTYRILEASLHGLSLVPYSSQGTDAVLSVRSAASLAGWDLPIAPASTPFELATARARVAEFAAGELPNRAPNLARLRRAYAIERSDRAADRFALQIADVVDGRMVVVPAALMLAAVEASELPAEEAALARQSLEPYVAKLRQEQPEAAFTPPWERGLSQIVLSARAGLPITDEERQMARAAIESLGIAGRSAGLEIPKDSSDTAEPAAMPPTGDGSNNSQLLQRSLELRAAELRLAESTLEKQHREQTRVSLGRGQGASS